MKAVKSKLEVGEFEVRGIVRAKNVVVSGTWAVVLVAVVVIVAIARWS